MQPETPTPGETWRHRDGWTAIVLQVRKRYTSVCMDNFETRITLGEQQCVHQLTVPLREFREHFTREAPDEGA